MTLQLFGAFCNNTWDRPWMEAVALAAHTCAGKALSPGNLRTQTACCCRWRLSGRFSPGGLPGRASPQNPSTENLRGEQGRKSGKKRAAGTCRSACCCASAPVCLWNVFYRLLVITRSSLQLTFFDLIRRGGGTNALRHPCGFPPNLRKGSRNFCVSADPCVNGSNYRNMSHLRISSCLLIKIWRFPAPWR